MNSKLNTKLIRLMLCALIAFTPVLFTSCSDDDNGDDTGTPSNNGGGNNNSNNNNKANEGTANYELSGEVEAEITDSTFFIDTSDFNFFPGTPTVDQAMLIANVSDSISITAMIYQNNSSSRIGEGTYQVNQIDSSATTGCGVLFNTIPSSNSYSSTDQSGGSIVIQSRTDTKVTGRFEDVKVIGNLGADTDKSVTINGPFKALHIEER